MNRLFDVVELSAVAVLLYLFFMIAGCALPRTEPYRVRQADFQTRLQYLRYCDHYWLGRGDICVD